jgi:ketosteroid isomerase-like protein
VSRRFLPFLLLFAVAALVEAGGAQDITSNRQDETIIALERGALDRWGRGDPEGYLGLYAPRVTYFDPLRETRIDGIDALRQALEPVKGLVKVDRFEMIAPRVDRIGDVAILTYNLASHSRRPDGATVVTRWNSTAVYQRIGGAWRILHSHWSFTKPDLKVPMVSQ